MNRCPECGSLRVLSALDGSKAFCARCHRRLSPAVVRPLFAGTAGEVVQLLRRGSEPDPTPAA
jgi:uncharacterized paraquat-inducible protein A